MAYVIPKIPASGKEAPAAARQDAARQHVAWLQVHPEKRGVDPYRYVLLLRFILLNLFGFGLLGAAYAQGLVTEALTADRTYLSVVIFLVFMVGFGLSAFKVWQTSYELNSVRDFEAGADSPAARYLAPMVDGNADSRANLVGALRMKIAFRTAVVRHIASSLVLLGLIGTVVGFIIALGGVDPEHASDVKAIAPMVSTLIQGMSTALYTTLIGAVLNIWLMANHQVLAGGTVKLITALVELAEIHARD
ncbi:MAG: hypothetical protein BMS9Abin01_2603 [Gammaproteobacteria bacterium]|nr:MAG: hypothetical protein BMS9Abin01_2603 [Gammaproteobacteria bacterium]